MNQMMNLMHKYTFFLVYKFLKYFYNIMEMNSNIIKFTEQNKMTNIAYKTRLENQIRQYYQETPIANKCISYLLAKYPYIMPQIDHIAYRFLDKSDWIEFNNKLDTNYICRGRLDFPLKTNDRYFKHAHWYSHPIYPRLFASFIDITQEDETTIKQIKDTYPNDIDKYNQLKQMDQYLAWTTVWKDDINHMAFDLSRYPGKFEDLINEMIDDLQLDMNKFGENDIIMISEDGLLKQCSTKSNIINGIPKAYIEFVCRYKNETGQLRDGFDTFSANNIFESTCHQQVSS